MDFDDTRAEARFRAELRDWLEANAERSTGSDLFRMAAGGDEELLARSKVWQRKLFDAGWTGITWPAEYGGRGGTAIEQLIFNQERAAFDIPLGAFAVGVGMVGPTLIAHGTDTQKKRFLEPLLRGDEIWCQLFSEPGAGSDLANLATRAEYDGDSGDWVVNGQKVWTSNAHLADFGVLLARTAPDAPKHHGITYLLCDMRTPGVETRRLRQLNGHAHFSEVFLSDVRVPPDRVVGEVHGGWTVAMTTLAHERSLMGGGFSMAKFSEMTALARATGNAHDVALRQRLASVYASSEILRYLGYRVQTALSQGRQPGAETSVMKLVFSRYLSEAAALCVAMQGPRGALLYDDAPLQGLWQTHFLQAPSLHIAGGSDEVQHNVIGEQVLGLPREPRPDKTQSWSDSQRSAR